MKNLKAAGVGLAIVAFAGITAFTHTASAASEMMSDSDHKMMTSCMAMSSDDMMKDSSCAAMMKKTNMSAMDIKTMKSCMAMSHDAMMADTSCSSMMKMHPEMTKESMNAQ